MEAVTPGDIGLELLVRDVEMRHRLKKLIWEAEGAGDYGAPGVPAREVAERMLSDCKDTGGVLDELTLVREITRVIAMLYRAQGRLPLFRDIQTGEVTE